MLNVFLFFWNIRSINTFETNSAVKSDAAIPKIGNSKTSDRSGTFHNRIKPVSSVVRLESIIVTKAVEYPESIALRIVFPSESSSRMRSNMITFASTFIPIKELTCYTR